MSPYLQQLETDFSDFESVLPQHYQPIAGAVMASIMMMDAKCRDEVESAISLLSLDCTDIVDMPDYTKRVGDLYLLWRAHDQDLSLPSSKDDEQAYMTPALSCLVASMLAFLEIPSDNIYARAAMVGAFLADLPNKKLFHCNAHYRDVTSTVFRILTAFRQLRNQDDDLQAKYPELNERQQALLICAATIHDFCHDGKGNSKDGEHIPMRLEAKAFHCASPVLNKIGLSTEDLEDLRLMILATDVSYGEQALSPSRVLTRCYDYIYGDADEPVIAADDYKFMIDSFMDRKSLTLMAMILEEADLFTSAGLSYEYAKMATVLVAKETEILSTKASTFHGFLEMICGGILKTPAGQKLFKPTFDQIYKIVSEDVKNDTDYDVSA
jgi:hypothetical protein